MQTFADETMNLQIEQAVQRAIEELIANTSEQACCYSHFVTIYLAKTYRGAFLQPPTPSLSTLEPRGLNWTRLLLAKRTVLRRSGCLRVQAAECQLLERLLEVCKQRRWLGRKYRQSTDAVHVLVKVGSLPNKPSGGGWTARAH